MTMKKLEVIRMGELFQKATKEAEEKVAKEKIAKMVNWLEIAADHHKKEEIAVRIAKSIETGNKAEEGGLRDIYSR